MATRKTSGGARKKSFTKRVRNTVASIGKKVRNTFAAPFYKKKGRKQKRRGMSRKGMPPVVAQVTKTTGRTPNGENMHVGPRGPVGPLPPGHKQATKTAIRAPNGENITLGPPGARG